jgi:hypothetical protein
MTLAGLEGRLLRSHGEGVELRKRVGGAPEGAVHRPVRLLQPRRLRLPLLPRHHDARSPLTLRSVRVEANPTPGTKRQDEMRAGSPRRDADAHESDGFASPLSPSEFFFLP